MESYKKTCRRCNTTYETKTFADMETHFYFKIRAKTRFHSICTPCKKVYDKNRAEKIKKTELQLYREFMRQETKKIVKTKLNCSVTSCQNPAELHHFDYEKPSEVLPVCRDHHARIHRLNRLLEESEVA